MQIHHWGRAARGVGIALALAAMASTARAHEDPAGCFQTGPAIVVSVFRANGTTGVVGSISECETINYRATLSKATNAESLCAFSGGTFVLKTPDGVPHTISMDVPCLGGTSGEGCDAAVTQLQSPLVPYTVSAADVVGGLITATAGYAGGVAHDQEGNTPGVSAMTPKSTPVQRCADNDACTVDVCDPTKQGAAACSTTPKSCDDGNVCTADACDPATGACTNVTKTCNDNNLCTTDVCNPATGQCTSTPKSCGDNNKCTTDTCNPATGQCENKSCKDCNDYNLCTVDSCDPVTGYCKHVDAVTPTCDDHNACTVDSCKPSTGKCIHTAKTCDDHNSCTSDRCDASTGKCVFTRSRWY